MGGVISGLLGTNSSVQTTSQSAQGALQPYLNSQNQLATQLQGVANGTGPNPALNQLNQTTQQNAQQAASTLASQRGLNAGLAARTAAQNQVNANQQAAGQAATLGAQQQIAAQQQLAGLYAQQEGATNQASGVNAQIASGNQQASQGIVGGLLGSAGSALGLAHGGAVPMASGGALVSAGDLSVSSNPVNSGGPVSSFGQAQQGAGGKALQSGLTSLGGGIHSAMTKQSTTAPSTTNSGQPTSDDWANMMSAPDPSTGGGNATSDQWASFMAPGMAQGGLAQKAMQLAPLAAMFAAKGGKVPVVLSPGEKKLSPEAAKKVAMGKADPMKAGGTVPGKAKVPGDSLKNDVVPDKLEPGSIVIPRSVVQSKHPHLAAMKFVQAHLGIAPTKKSKKVAA